jgi:EAL and modified HD-GYP domain-containing signal transduction protein
MFDRFIARQAILKDNLTLLGYDLIFRSSDSSPQPGGTPPAAYTIDAATMVFPWEALVGHGLAFIPFQARELSSGAALLLPRAKSVIDIGPDVLCSAEVVLGCQELKNAGYRLSVSGWKAQRERRPLAVLADFLRVDVNTLSPDECSRVAAGYRNDHAALIAQNVSTWETHKTARRLGFTFFQGDFFLKPQLFRRREIAGTRLNALRLLRSILRDPLDLHEIEAVVREEPALTYKLLRYLNSPVMERPVEVRSIRNAIALLGDQEFRRWASLVAVVTPATDKTDELVRTALTRAFFCEQLARRAAISNPYDYFFTGLFSLMDAVLDRPLAEIVRELALPHAVRSALLGDPGILHDALQAAIAYEQGAWARLTGAMARVALPESCGPDLFAAAGRSTAAIVG